MISLLCTSRSGSTNLARYLSGTLKNKLVISPFNNREEKIGSLKDNYFYKMMIHDKPNVYDTHYDYGCDVISKFNKVILMDRDNRIEQSESLCFRKIKYGGDFSKYHIREPYLNIDKKMVDKIKKHYEYQGDVLSKLSIEFNIPLFKYEDIYYGNGLEELSKYLKIDINDDLKKKYILNTKKERIFNNKEKILC